MEVDRANPESVPHRDLPRPPGNFYHSLLLWFSRSLILEYDERENYVDVREALALLKFANERAINGVTMEMRANLAKSIEEFKRLKDTEERSDACQALGANYALLADQTYRAQQVNGRTIIDSEEKADSYIGGAGALGSVEIHRD